MINIPSQLDNQRFIFVDNDKRPIEKGWQLIIGGANYSKTDERFIKYLGTNNQYGILCGINNLVVIDFDSEDIQKAVLDEGILPSSFSVKTARKKLLHIYLYVDDCTSWKVMDKDKNTLADIQGTSKQVIGPGSTLIDGRMYEVVDDVPIATISSNLLHKIFDKYDYNKNQEVLQQVSDGLTLDDFNKKFGPDKAVEEIKRQLKISDILREEGISTSRNPTKCPFHSSRGGKCLGFDDNKGVCHCFHCDFSSDAIGLYQAIHNISFVEAKTKLCEKFGIRDTYFVEKKQAEAVVENGRPMQKLPCKNYTVEQFGADISKYFIGDESIFFKPDEDNIVEIKKFNDKLLKREIIGFRVVDTKRLVNIIEKKVNCYIIEYVKKQQVMVRQTPTKLHIELLSANEDFLNALYPIKRFLSYPIPFIDINGELIIPKYRPGKGYYDERFQAYFTAECPELTLMNVNEAKFILKDILSEFCFKEELDRIMALAYIITPMCRGLYVRPTCRTPIFILSANRERAGKDYLAGIRGILYEGQAIDDTPFVTGEHNESNNEELRKKLTAALKMGRRLFHSSNNRGYLNNAQLEQFSTSEVWRDRELGKSHQLELSNEVDLSLSANVGLTYTADLYHRSRPINLFYSQENPNERAFSRIDLHGYVLQYRARILSAIYTLINAWVIAGRPFGKTLFTSFPEWARIVGGIMTYHGLGDPCVSVEDANVGGDKETQSMKDFCGFMSVYQLNDVDNREGGYTIGSLRAIVKEAQSREDIEGFAHWDLDARPDQVKFGNLIKRFVGREFHCRQQVRFKVKDGVDEWTHFKVQLIIAKDHDRSNKILYGFPMIVEQDKPLPSIELSVKEKQYVEEFLDSRPNKLSKNAARELLLAIRACEGDKELYIGTLVDRGITDELVDELLTEGTLYRTRGGYVRIL